MAEVVGSAVVHGSNICVTGPDGYRRTVAKLRGTSLEMLHEHHGTRYVGSISVLELLRAVGVVAR